VTTEADPKAGFTSLADAPDALTVPEVARLLRVGRNQAYALVSSGLLRGCRVGHGIRVPKLAVERFLLGPDGAADGVDK
jgi:excisionase family DNA binding protein